MPESMPEELCHCGKPLHYSDPKMREAVERLIGKLGAKVQVQIRGKTWLVPRHYIALHGVKAWEIEKLGFEEVIEVEKH